MYIISNGLRPSSFSPSPLLVFSFFFCVQISEKGKLWKEKQERKRNKDTCEKAIKARPVRREIGDTEKRTTSNTRLPNATFKYSIKRHHALAFCLMP